MKEVATIKFADAETSDEGIIIVRSDDQKIALGVSIKSSGDIEVFLNKVVAAQIIAALTKAIS